MPQTNTRPVDRRPVVAPDRDLTHPLQRLKGAIRRFVAYDVMLFVGLYLSVWFWLGVGIDYGLFKAFGVDIAQQLTPAIRIGATIVVGVTLVALVIWRVTVLMNKEFSLSALALVLEKRHPKLLGDRLITAIQMADVEYASQQGYSADLVRHTIQEARERMQKVNVRAVFNWGRLWLKLVLIALVWVLAVTACFAIHAAATGGFDGARAAKKMADVCGIFTERNVLFTPTPWPRRAHLEVTDFDDDGHPNELRIGKGSATPPKVSARAIKWVVADDPWKNPDGWRAMTVADLKTYSIAPPASVESDAARIDDWERTFGPSDDDPTLLALTVAADMPANSRNLRKLEVPGVLKMRVDGMQSRSRNSLDMVPDATGKYAAEVANLTETVKFTISAEDFTTARRQITLVPPPTLVDLYRDEFQPAYMHYSAPISTSGDVSQFELRGRLQKLAGKKVSISSDKSVFSTPIGTELHITAESDKDLKLIELRPIGPNPLTVPEFLRVEAKEETRDERGVITDERFVDMPISHLANAVENRLELDRDSATGLRVKEADFNNRKLAVRRFTLKFEGKRAIRQLDKPTEFQIAMTDTDNVTSVRTIAITAIDDAPPQVEVLVDPVLRKVGGVYWVTPVARVPFLTDSKVWDDHGLSSLRFEFKKTAEESQSVVTLRAMAAASLTAQSLAPSASWAMPATVVHSQTQFDLFFGATIPQTDMSTSARLPGVEVERFGNETKTLQRLTVEQLDAVTAPRDGGDWIDRLVTAELARQKINATNMQPTELAKLRGELLARLKGERPGELRPDRGPQAVKIIKLSDLKADAFDLQRFMPELPMKPSEAVQQRYKIELYVTAKDTNVELTGKDGKPADPRMTRNLDPIRLMVVSEQDLLVEIGKDEEMQGQRMDDAVAKATGGKSKMDREFSLLRGLGAMGAKDRNDQMLSSQVRLTDIGQDLNKVRELLTSMKTEYEKLYREMDVNRFSAVHMQKYRNEAGTAEDRQTGLLDLLTLILDENRVLSKAEKSTESVRSSLAAQQQPTDAAMNQAATDYINLIFLLNRLLDQIGTNKGITEAKAALKRIIDEQNLLLKAFKDMKDYLAGELQRPTVILPKTVPTVQVGKTVKVKLGVRWKLYPETSLFIGMEVPKSTELKFTPEEGVLVKAKGDEEITEVEIEVTGTKPGVHTVTLRPGTFRTLELQIEVTK